MGVLLFGNWGTCLGCAWGSGSEGITLYAPPSSMYAKSTTWFGVYIFFSHCLICIERREMTKKLLFSGLFMFSPQFTPWKLG
jgi:hypothetical protein